MFTLASQEKTALIAISLVILVCISGTLIIDSMGKETFSKEYNPGFTDNTLVSYTGVIDKVTKITSGSVILDISGVTVFIPASAGMSQSRKEGETIRVTGVIQHYNGREEIFVSKESDITRVSESQVKDQHSGQSESEFQD